MPLLVRYAEHLAGLVGNVADEAITGRLRAVWSAVANRFRSDSQAEGALNRLGVAPGDTRRQAAVEGHLDDLLREDESFARALAELVNATPGLTKAATQITVTNAGAVAIGGSLRIHGSGGSTAGRDVGTGGPNS
ncbi:hypothetical protein ACQEVG_17490 [Streptomyces sp. CA-135486]|uniref:hypothetical protein n=1 Tax=Streptomyces sp. CA-135486 TaxID=3240049 RepID=UPI003D8B3D3A